METASVPRRKTRIVGVLLVILAVQAPVTFVGGGVVAVSAARSDNMFALLGVVVGVLVAVPGLLLGVAAGVALVRLRRDPPAGLRAARGLGLTLALVSLVLTVLFVNPVGVIPLLLGLVLLVAASAARAAR